MNTIELKPKNRSWIRVFLGVRYYRLKRHLQWYLTGDRYAKELESERLAYEITGHATPLYRKLRGVDMWLQENKVHNLGIAIKKVNGIVIKPGETFSYWKLIGNPTSTKGYKKGMVLYYGKFREGTGGGLCQLSNMIFWMAIHTPLTVVERYRHSYDVFPDSNRTQPFGSGATCVYNYRDLMLRNDTEETYQINVWLEDEYLKGEILSDCEKYFSYQVYEAQHEITHEFWGAYVRHNQIRRKTVDGAGDIIHDEGICENHALMMYEPFIENRT